MGVFKKLFGRDGPDEYDVIRALVLHHFRSHPSIGEQMVKRLGESELMSLPEATIFKIVETHFRLKKQGRPDQEIFSSIEARRSKIGSGIMPKPLNLESYVKYRLDIEHGHKERLSQQFIGQAIRFCQKYLKWLGSKIRCDICKREKEEKDFLPIYLKNKVYICRSCDHSGIRHRLFRTGLKLVGMVFLGIVLLYVLIFLGILFVNILTFIKQTFF